LEIKLKYFIWTLPVVVFASFLSLILLNFRLFVQLWGIRIILSGEQLDDLIWIKTVHEVQSVYQYTWFFAIIFFLLIMFRLLGHVIFKNQFDNRIILGQNQNNSLTQNQLIIGFWLFLYLFRFLLFFFDVNDFKSMEIYTWMQFGIVNLDILLHIALLNCFKFTDHRKK
jgi:hypothetical protein